MSTSPAREYLSSLRGGGIKEMVGEEVWFLWVLKIWSLLEQDWEESLFLLEIFLYVMFFMIYPDPPMKKCHHHHLVSESSFCHLCITFMTSIDKISRAVWGGGRRLFWHLWEYVP